MIAGQALDMAFETRDAVSLDECLTMEAGKTGALLGCASSIGALLAGGGDASSRRSPRTAPPRPRVPGRRRPARHLGSAGRDRQAGVERPPPAQEDAAGRGRVGAGDGERAARAPRLLATAPRPSRRWRGPRTRRACGGRASTEASPPASSTPRSAPSVPPTSTRRAGRAGRARPLRRGAPVVTVAAVPRTTPVPRSPGAGTRCLALQDPAGWWKGELETNVTMDAEDLLLRQFLGVRTQAARGAPPHWIRSQQRADGTWANFYGGPADLSTTVEAYVALRLAGDPPTPTTWRRPPRSSATPAASSAPASSPGSGSRSSGCGPGRAAGAAAGGHLPAVVVPAQHLRLRLLGPPDDRAADGRRLHRPVRPLPFGIDELHGRRRHGSGPRRGRSSGGFGVLDGVLHRYDRRPFRPLRRSALAAAERWIVHRQEADGWWGGIQPPWVYSLIALSLRGYPLDHPVMRAGFAGLERFTIDDDRGRRLEACQSPVWDTALAVIALADAGVAARRPGPRAGGRLAARRGDAGARRLDGAPTAARTRRLGVRVRQRQLPRHRRHRRGRAGARRVEHPDGPGRRRRRRAVRWVEGMQCRDGGWGAFDADNTGASAPAAVLRLRRGDRPAERRRHRPRARDAGGRAAADPRRLAAAWRGSAAAGARRLVVRSVGRQLRLRHGRGRARAAAGGLTADPAPCRPRSTGSAHQNEDGGWGEDMRSYRDDASRGAGPRPRRRPRGRCSRCSPPAGADAARRGVATWSRRSAPTARGTSRGTPAPASRATSTSTTTCTGWCSRSRRSAGSSTGRGAPAGAAR